MIALLKYWLCFSVILESALGKAPGWTSLSIEYEKEGGQWPKEWQVSKISLQDKLVRAKGFLTCI